MKKSILSEIYPDFHWRKHHFAWRHELLAAVIGALLVIPQGVTFAYLAGVPAVHGIYCAIYLTLLTSVFGGSIMMSGPNTATSILLGVSAAHFADRGSPLFVDYVLLLSFLVGVMQLFVWIFRGARIFKHITPFAIAGITTGVGFLIVFASLNGVLGLPTFKTKFLFEKIGMIVSDPNKFINWSAFAVGLVTIVFGFASRKFWPRHYLLVALFAGTCSGLVLNHFGQSYGLQPMQYLGVMHIDLLRFSFPKLMLNTDVSFWMKLLPATATIAFIGLAQTLVISRDLKNRVNPKLNLHKEVFALGLANILAPFLSAFAGSGSFNRSQANEEMGAVTPVVGILTAILVALTVVFIGDFFKYLPLSVIAGVLFIVGYRMIRWNSIQRILSSKEEFLEYGVVLFSVLAFGLTAAIIVAIGVSVYRKIRYKETL